MRIKKVEWEKDGISKYKVILPFGYNAEIIPRFDGFAGWAIYKGHELIKNDYCATISGAQMACEEAWEEIVKEALEPSDLYVISTEEGIDSICTSLYEAELRQQEVMACSGCMEGFVIVEEFVVDPDGNVTEVEYEEE